MVDAFPVALDVLTNPAATDFQDTTPHHTQHSRANDAIEALEAKVGINSSADANSLDYLTRKKSFTFVLETPTSSEVFPMFQFPMAITLTKVKAAVYGGTSVTFQIQKRADATLNSSGTNMLTSSLVADADGAETTSFAVAAAVANSYLMFISSALSGVVGKVIVEVEFTIDRT